MATRAEDAADETEVIGRRVGHYEVVARLGSGGQGLVYRGRDLSLGRDVALKCPHPEKLTEPGVRRRFMREARLAASLSHPNIVPIFAVLETDDAPWLVMELVDGRSLSEILREGGSLEVADTLRHAEEIAGALGYAHAHGVLHRDLSPRNILLGRDGRARLLDFGLAHHFVPPEEISTSSTQSADGAGRAGAVAGTPAYVAPELWLGRPADFRSDLFSFGAVLYEMCTGHPAFAEREYALLLNAILHHEPPPISRYTYEVPAELERIIRKCLRKDPAERYQGAADLVVDLRALRQETTPQPAPSGPAPPGVPLEAVPVASHAHGLWWESLVVVLSMGVLVAAILGGLAWYLWSHRPRDGGGAPVMRALVERAGEDYDSRFSPDGQWVSFISNRGGRRGLWAVNLAGSEIRRMTTEGDDVTSHVWSPDGREIALLIFTGEGTFLRIVPAFGGAARRSVPLDPDFSWGSLLRWWGSRIYIASNATGLWSFDLPAGRLDALVPATSQAGLRFEFDVCGGESRIAFTERAEGKTSVWTADLAGRGARRVTSGASVESAPRWIGASCRDLVFSSNRSGQIDLWKVEIDQGAGAPITSGGDAKRAEDTSLDGTKVSFQDMRESAHLWLLDPGPGESQGHPITFEAREDLWPSLSRDGSRAVFQRSRPSRQRLVSSLDSEILAASIGPGGLTATEVLATDAAAPSLSPGGDRVAFLRPSERGGCELWIADLASKHSWRLAPRVALSGLQMFPVEWRERNLAWSPDGRSLYFVAEADDGAREIRVWSPRAGGGDARVLVGQAAAAGLRSPRVSPGGGHLAYLRNSGEDPPRPELRVLDLRAGADRGLDALEEDRDLLLAGWLDEGSVLALAAGHGADWTDLLDVIAIDLSGRRRPVARIEGAVGGTARLDAARGRLYVTLVEKGEEVHNLHAVNLADGSVRRVTDNRIPGISFTGPEILGDGRLVFSRQERTEDIWLIEFAH